LISTDQRFRPSWQLSTSPRHEENLRIPQDTASLIGESSPRQPFIAKHLSLISAWDRLSNRRRDPGISQRNTEDRPLLRLAGVNFLCVLYHTPSCLRTKHDVRSDDPRPRVLLAALNILRPDSTESTFRISSSALTKTIRRPESKGVATDSAEEILPLLAKFPRGRYDCAESALIVIHQRVDL
jgi:hypothetical protein